MRIWSKVGAAGTGLKMFRTSWFIWVPSADASSRIQKVMGERLTAPPPHAWRVASAADQLFSSSTFRPRERISLTSTLKLSGMPASKVSSPRTIDS